MTTTKTRKVEPEAEVSLKEKFKACRNAMVSSLIERHDEVDMVLTAVICKEHPLLVGPPGTGKSFLVDTLLKWVSSRTRKFNILIGKFSMPEEVFGPVSIKDLKEGRYVRVVDRKLPEADFAFIDEIFKASSAILNSLLKILNERKFENGADDVDCPLRVALAASNEWPDANELGALFDRFLLRKTVRPVSKIGRRKLLREKSLEPKFESTITNEELDAAHEEAMSLEFTEAAWESLDKILDELAKEGIRPGDRRMRKAVSIARGFAYLRGAEEVEPVHLEVLKYVLWDAPEQESKTHKIVSKNANPIGSKITELLMLVASIVEAAGSERPEEGVAKLQEVADELKKLPEHDRKEAAIRYTTKEIKTLYNKVIRLEE